LPNHAQLVLSNPIKAVAPDDIVTEYVRIGFVQHNEIYAVIERTSDSQSAPTFTS